MHYTGISVDLSICNCMASSGCAEACFAKFGSCWRYFPFRDSWPYRTKAAHSASFIPVLRSSSNLQKRTRETGPALILIGSVQLLGVRSLIQNDVPKVSRTGLFIETRTYHYSCFSQAPAERHEPHSP